MSELGHAHAPDAQARFGGPCASPCSHLPGSRCPLLPTAASRRSCACSATGSSPRGHDVTLFAAPGSDSSADVVDAARRVLSGRHPEGAVRGRPRRARLRRRSTRRRERGEPLRRDPRPRRPHRAGDGRPRRGAAGAHAARPVHRGRVPASTPSTARKATIVAISQSQLDDAPDEMGGGVVVHNPIDCSEWPYRGGEGRLPALDRAHVARQGPAPRDRGGARGRRAARARRAGPAGPGGVLRRGGRAARSAATGSSTSARPTPKRKRELYAARPRAAACRSAGPSRSGS